MKKFFALMLLLCFFSLSACTTLTNSGDGTSVPIDNLRGARPFDRRTIQVEVDREQYREALAQEGSMNDARLVQVFHRGEADTELKEYRLLDIRPGSVYDLLKLKQADILIATDGYVVPVASVFWNYLQLISRFEKASIEIRRGGTPILYEYIFIDK